MLFFVGTRFHRYTLDALVATDCGGRGIGIVPVSYDDLFAADLLPGGTYIFTDIERLSAYERLLAAAAYRAMAAQPDRFRPVNDPARVRTRYGLLRALRQAGVNGFDAYRAGAGPRPRRFPVFVRCEANHDMAVTGLLPDQAALDHALAALEDGGQPLDSLLVIEFAAEPFRPGIWRRSTAFLIGGEVIAGVPFTGAGWMVKRDDTSLVEEAVHEADLAAMRAGRHGQAIRDAFALGRIEYGRLDYGIAEGRMQIYEINTNPNHHGLDPDHPSLARRAAREFGLDRMTRRMAELAAGFPAREAMPFEVPLLRAFRQANGGAGLPWRP